MEIAYIIPARLESSRFPGKPLKQILGKEMILHVIDRVASVASNDSIFVATDSDEITSVVLNYGINVLKTGNHATGTDRLAEANEELKASFVINVQGDEPVFNPSDILVAREFLLTSSYKVITGFCRLSNKREWTDANTVKVVCSKSGKLLYISRAPIPGSKNKVASPSTHRQVCIYGYTQEALSQFSKMERTPLEISEDHEVLRFLENDISVGAVELSDWSIPVDVASDIEDVEQQLLWRFNPKN